jgi:hypothetical protein
MTPKVRWFPAKVLLGVHKPDRLRSRAQCGAANLAEQFAFRAHASSATSDFSRLSCVWLAKNARARGVRGNLATHFDS